MARYIAVRLDNDELSDQEALGIISDLTAGDDELSDPRIIELGFQRMVSGSRTWHTPHLIRTTT